MGLGDIGHVIAWRILPLPTVPYFPIPGCTEQASFMLDV